MFDFIFKYSPVVFSEGSIYFNYLPSLLVVLLAAAGVALIVFFVYRKTTLAVTQVFRAVLLTLRITAVLVLLFILLEPVVSVSTVVPRKSSLLVLVDDSKSMSIADVDQEQSRRLFAGELLGTPDNPALLEDLRQNFKLQLYRFSGGTEHLGSPADLAADGEATDLAQSLSFAVEHGKHNALSGIVLLTDGVNNSQKDPLEVASVLKSNKLPVFVVGIGSETTRDVELARVSANQSVIENSVVELSALVKGKNLVGKEIGIELLEEGRLVKKQTVSLKRGATRTAMKFSPQKSGFARYSVRVIPDQDEHINENNSQDFIIDNRDRKARVLYVEGYPRAEFKYLRRAIDADPGIELISLLRTGPDKFYRQGITDKQELKDGYPSGKRALFEYDAIILGSVERAFFTPEQLENTVAFVAQRGGGLLMLGGSQAFSQGGYAGSSIEDVLPVEMPAQSSRAVTSHATTFRDKYGLLVTPEGYRNPVLQLASDAAQNREIWDSLPDLEGYNLLGRAKPGATVLAVHPLSEPSDPKIIMAQQRFGRGRSMVFATSSSWHWQMGMPHEDSSHERFWRQVMRWLALGSPDPVESTTDKDIYVPNAEVTLRADVRDSSFSSIKDATIKANIRKPSGGVEAISFKWSSGETVDYSGAYHPKETGMHLVEISAYSARGEFLGSSESAFLVEDSRAEFSDAHLQASFLKRVAEVSGGKYYHQDEARSLPDEISVMPGSYSKLVEYDLWDMPLFFLIVIVLVSGEWYLRRNRGLS